MRARGCSVVVVALALFGAGFPLAPAHAAVERVVAVGDVSVVEGNRNLTTVHVPIRLDADALRVGSVRVRTTEGTTRPADPDADYRAIDTRVNIGAGTRSTSIEVQVVGDTLREKDQTFRVEVLDPVGFVIGRSLGVVTIIDDDTPVASVADVTTYEGDEGTSVVRLPVTLDRSPTKTSTVQWSIVRRTADPDDVVPASGTITFSPTTPAPYISVIVVGDEVNEFRETFSIELSEPDGLVIGRSGTVTILDDDPHGVGNTMSVGNVTVRESDASRTAWFPVRVRTPLASTATITYSLDGDLVNDISGGGGTVTVASGVSSFFLPVTVRGDTRVERTSTFTVTMDIVVGGSAVPVQRVGTGTILDDDTLTVGIGDVAVVEGDRGTAVVRVPVVLSDQATRDVTVRVATRVGSATQSEFDRIRGRLVTIKAGHKLAYVDVTLASDRSAESNETVTLVLSRPLNATVSRDTGVVTIIDDD